jgi:MFS family permease
LCELNLFHKMSFRPIEEINPKQIQTGLQYVTRDGLAAETMTTFTSGAFLVAIALFFGASNFQIGLLAALPTFTNVFQLLSIWLVQKYNNRKAISVIGNFFARLPLVLIGVLPFLFTKETSLKVLIFLLFFHYLFGSIAGASWNSWMKDLIPERVLGSYFSHRSRLTQIFNVTLSLLLALGLDYIKVNYPDYEMVAYSYMFLMGGLMGLSGVYALYKTPEPKSFLPKENLASLFSRPLKEKNFRKLLVFNSLWLFSVNLATPFFSVYMLRALGLPLSYIIGFTVISQISSIFFIRMWGAYADKYSNKTIIIVCAPLFITSLIGWSLITLLSGTWVLVALFFLHLLSGLSNAGINLALTNIGLKLAHAKESIVYIAAKNMITAFFSAAAPLVGGLLADFFSVHSLTWTIDWQGPQSTTSIYLLELKQWNFFFIIGAFLAIISLQFLKPVMEIGEINRDILVTDLKNAFKVKFADTNRVAWREWLYQYTNVVFVTRQISSGFDRLVKYRGLHMEEEIPKSVKPAEHHPP